MAFFNKARMAALSPTNPPKDFAVGKLKKKKVDDSKVSKPSGFLRAFGKK